MLILRGLCIVALASSAASLSEQSFGNGTFCSFESGCEAVTSSQYGQFLGLPLPYYGILGFTALLGISTVGGAFTARVVRGAAALAALAGAALLVVQFAVLGKVCQLCLIVDVCAIASGIIACFPLPAAPASNPARAAWGVLAVLAVMVPLAVGYSEVKPEPPDWVKAEWLRDKITIVEVTDFECEHCRQADEYVRERLKDRPDIRLVRVPVAMPKHANSRTAALAFHAAAAQGRANEMAEGLFAANSLTAADCRVLAAKLGLNLAEYDRVVADAETDRKVSEAGVRSKAAGPGVPLIWIHEHMSFGMPNSDNFDRPLREAKPRQGR
ncbi:MAG: vitamin K epoxide reductase family protein [Gemmataceae bacterium]